MNSLVSICIPAYKQPALLERCLQSVAAQTYKRVEVVVTDDSPDEAVKIVSGKFADKLNIQFYRNEKPLGSPANWNAALEKATGDYVLLLHHDDYFATPQSLEKFLRPFEKNRAVDFVFGRNPTVSRLAQGRSFSGKFFRRYYRHPFLLLTGNTIGAPSNVLLRSSAVEPYNTAYKWIVDIDFYIRLFRRRRKFFYVDETLVEIGIHDGQVSNECADDYGVQVFENVLFVMDNHVPHNSVRLFDFFWRLLRNAKISSLSQLLALNLPVDRVPGFIKSIIAVQRLLPAFVLRSGVMSKALMMATYLRNLASQAKLEK